MEFLEASPGFAWWIARNWIVYPYDLSMSIECLGVEDFNVVHVICWIRIRHPTMSIINGGQGCQKFLDFGKLNLLGDSWQFERWWTWYGNMLSYAILISLECPRGVESNIEDVLSSFHFHPDVMSWRNCKQRCQEFFDFEKLKF